VRVPISSCGMIIGTKRDQKVGQKLVYDPAISVNAKLSSMIHHKAWNWGHTRSDDLVTTLSRLPMIDFDEFDKAVWISSKLGSFSLANAWDQIRLRSSALNWWRIVWFAKAIPRYAFITWLAMRERLSTKERLASWGISCDMLCVLCRASIQYRDHLFFKCSFSQRFWRKIKSLCCQEDLDDEWENLISLGEKHWKGKNLSADCCRLGFSVVIYHIWAQRNAILQQGTARTEEQIVGIIK
jgi:hypothetical protein